jgi:hypothetical protein
MQAKYRTDVFSRKTIVSTDTNAGDRYTVLTDWWSEMEYRARTCVSRIGNESINRTLEVSCSRRRAYWSSNQTT